MPLFVDTGAFYAWFNSEDDHHKRATAVFERIKAGELPYQPVYTSRYVVAELVTLILYRIDHSSALSAFDRIDQSDTFNVLPVDHKLFMAARAQFERYNDHNISLTDHISGVLAKEYSTDRIFAFDSDFRTLGFTVVPVDTGEP